MTRWQLTVSLLILLLAGIYSTGFASGTTATVEVSFAVLPFQSLFVAGDDSGDATVYSRFDLRQPTEADFAVGYIEERSALTLEAVSNIPWTGKVHKVDTEKETYRNGDYGLTVVYTTGI
jgi:hypothetical protein